MKRLALALGFAASAGACSPDTNWTDLRSIEQLKGAFNRDAGNVRLVLILSPT